MNRIEEDLMIAAKIREMNAADIDMGITEFTAHLAVELGIRLGTDRVRMINNAHQIGFVFKGQRIGKTGSKSHKKIIAEQVARNADAINDLLAKLLLPPMEVDELLPSVINSKS